MTEASQPMPIVYRIDRRGALERSEHPSLNQAPLLRGAPPFAPAAAQAVDHRSLAAPRIVAMEMHQIRYFLVLCEELNFTRAAEKCHVAQPALTRAIKLLEEEFGGLLFHRERARTHLSELGQAVRPYLEEAQRQSQQAKYLATSLIELKSTPLKLGVMCTIGPGNFVGLLSNLQAQHPGIELQIMDASAADLQARLLDGGLEAAIYCWPDQIDDRLHYLPLFREQFFIVLGQRHRLAANNAVRVADLNGERYLNRINCEQVNLARDVFARQGTKVERVYRSDRDDWIVAMVAAGLGFGFMPQCSISERPDIVVRPLVEPEFWREVSLVTVRGRPHSPAIGALVREAMRTQWLGAPAPAAQNSQIQDTGQMV
jgi:DNA-binding transcriptional LysR family regulator